MDESNVTLDTYRLSDGRLLRDITPIEILMMADGAPPAIAGTIYRKVGVGGDRLTRHDDGTWLVICGRDDLPLLWGPLEQIYDWLRLVKDPL